jgi:Uma2 family endonuclease
MSAVIDKVEEKIDLWNGFVDQMFPLQLKINTKAWTNEEYFNFCQQHKDLRIETNKDGDLIIMPPTGAETGDKNSELNMQLRIWTKKDKKGKTFDSSTEFELPSGAKKSPDASWILKERYFALTQEERESFPPICPDFVAELRSRTDRLKPLQEKMAEYIENGVRLGWLIDPYQKQVHIYRKNGEIEILENPKTVSGEDVLEEFELDLEEIFT